jgi:hypothetical protein
VLMQGNVGVAAVPQGLTWCFATLGTCLFTASALRVVATGEPGPGVLCLLLLGALLRFLPDVAASTGKMRWHSAAVASTWESHTYRG